MAEEIVVPDEGGVAANGDAPKVEFSTEQQAKVQELVDSVYSKAKIQAKEDNKVAFEASNARIEELTQSIAELNKQPAQNPDAVTEQGKIIDQLNVDLKAKDDAFIAQNISVQDGQKERSLFDAIGKHDVVNGTQVKALLHSFIGINEDGKVFVKGEGDSPKLDKHGDAISVSSFVTEWLSENPHLLRGSNGGSGSSGGSGNGGKGVKYDLNDPAVIRALPQDELDRLMGEGINVHGAGGKVYSFGTVSNPFHEARKRKLKQK